MGIGGLGAVGMPGMGIGGLGAPTGGAGGIVGPPGIPGAPDEEGAGFFSIKESNKFEVDEGGFNPGPVKGVGVAGPGTEAGEGGTRGLAPIPASGELVEPVEGLGGGGGLPGAPAGGGFRPGALTDGILEMRESSNPGVGAFMPGTGPRGLGAPRGGMAGLGRPSGDAPMEGTGFKPSPVVGIGASPGF